MVFRVGSAPLSLRVVRRGGAGYFGYFESTAVHRIDRASWRGVLTAPLSYQLLVFNSRHNIDAISPTLYMYYLLRSMIFVVANVLRSRSDLSDSFNLKPFPRIRGMSLRMKAHACCVCDIRMPLTSEFDWILWSEFLVGICHFR